MWTYRLAAVGSLDNLTLGQEPIPRPGPGEVLVEVKANTLNFRNLKAGLAAMRAWLEQQRS